MFSDSILIILWFSGLKDIYFCFYAFHWLSLIIFIFFVIVILWHLNVLALIIFILSHMANSDFSIYCAKIDVIKLGKWNIQCVHFELFDYSSCLNGELDLCQNNICKAPKAWSFKILPMLTWAHCAFFVITIQTFNVR